MEEIRDFNSWTIAKSAELYEDLLGEDWIKEQLTRRDAELLKDKYAIILRRLEWHPVISEWPWHGDQPWRSAQDVSVPQNRALHFNVPAFHMQLAMGRPGFNLRASKKRLQNRTHFESFAFECKVASMYHLTRYDIEFLPESRVPVPTPDFVIKSRGGATYVECKIREYTQVWREYEKRACKVAEILLQLMDQAKINLSVSVHSFDALQGLKEHELRREFTLSLAESSHTGSFCVNASKFTWKNSGDFGVLKEGVFEPDPTPDDQFPLDATETGNVNGKQVYMNPRGIIFSTTEETDRVSSLLKVYDAALRQIEKHGPSILYIEIEKGTAGDVEKYELDARIRATFDPKKETYDPRSASLKYCIFTTIWEEMRNGVWSRQTRSHPILNEYSQAVFPDDFLRDGKFFPGYGSVELL